MPETFSTAFVRASRRPDRIGYYGPFNSVEEHAHLVEKAYEEALLALSRGELEHVKSLKRDMRKAGRFAMCFAFKVKLYIPA